MTNLSDSEIMAALVIGWLITTWIYNTLRDLVDWVKGHETYGIHLMHSKTAEFTGSVTAAAFFLSLLELIF